MDRFLKQTPLLNYEASQIQELINQRKWQELTYYDKIHMIYNFVRDEIPFGYNQDDVIPATQILFDGYGQCNTKTILFMALLRAVGIPCRIYGTWIDKSVQKGVVPFIYYLLAPKKLLHSWADVYYEGDWYSMEGLIIDTPYLKSVQEKFAANNGPFCGLGISVDDLSNPNVEWNKCDTCIQKGAVTDYLGIFDSPDDLYTKYAQTLSRFKQTIYSHFVRHLMNRKCKRIRKSMRHFE